MLQIADYKIEENPRSRGSNPGACYFKDGETYYVNTDFHGHEMNPN
jgi:hypothetical protein